MVIVNPTTWTLDTKWELFMQEFHLRMKGLKDEEYCKPIADYYDQLLIDNPDITFQELIDNFFDDSEKFQTSIHYILNIDGEEGLLSADLRQALINKLTDPRFSANLYIKCIETTIPQDSKLFKNFEGKLPRIEKELKEGILVRNKDG